jgi:Ca-activated chloride channel family protein
MRTKVTAGTLAALAIVWGPQVAFPQDVYVVLVHTHFTVTGPDGRIVTTLGRDDLTVYDNDVPQQVADFGQRVEAPVSVAVLVDRSQSVSDRFSFLASAATAFVHAALRHESDRGLVVGFDSKVYLLQDWTKDPSLLAGSIQRLSAAGGSSIFDAIFKTCRDKFDITGTRQNVLVLVTDGEDTTSVATFEQALQMAVLSRAVVYVVAVRAEQSMNPRELQGRRVLSQLAELTGGRLFYPDEQTPDGLGALFDRIQEELRSTYTLTYYHDVAPDNSFHRIRIQPADPSLVVHAPRGYYARGLPTP